MLLPNMFRMGRRNTISCELGLSWASNNDKPLIAPDTFCMKLSLLEGIVVQSVNFTCYIYIYARSISSLLLAHCIFLPPFVGSLSASLADDALKIYHRWRWPNTKPTAIEHQTRIQKRCSRSTSRTPLSRSVGSFDH